jgi:peptidoglycan hydrolase-like protein with peptidoglycan-binding domain
MDVIDPNEPTLFDIDEMAETDVDGDTSKGGLTLEGVEIPFDILEFGNGKLPDSALAKIGIGGHRLHASAAEAFKRLREAAAGAGIDLTLTDSYRTFDQQVDLKKRKPSLSATPGKSVHGWGFAVDVSVGMPPKSFGMSVLNWLKANAPGIGWHLGRPKDEPWHWVYRGPVTHKVDASEASKAGEVKAKPSADGELVVGSSGDRVKFVQRCLGLVEDGQFGQQTEAAVKAFQQSKGLMADGRVGPRTWSKLVVSAAPTDRPELKVGSSGDVVKWVQQRLGVTADGDFGPGTERAVKAFQQGNGLASDGAVGPRTWAALVA